MGFQIKTGLSSQTARLRLNKYFICSEDVATPGFEPGRVEFLRLSDFKSVSPKMSRRLQAWILTVILEFFTLHLD